MFRKKGSLFRRLFFPLAGMVLAGIVVMSLVAGWFSLSQEISEGLNSLGESMSFVSKYIAAMNKEYGEDISNLDREMNQILPYISYARKSDVFIIDGNTLDIKACGCAVKPDCSHREHKSEIINWLLIDEEIFKALKDLKNTDEEKGIARYHLKNVIPMVVVHGETKVEYKNSSGLFLVKEDKTTGDIIVATITLEKTLVPRIKNIVRMFAIAIPIALIALYGIISLYVYRFTKPLSRMVEVTKSYSKGDFTERIPAESKDELGELISSFNSMATALSITENSRRAFVANVSHELKTPMTTIGGFIDGILDGTIPPEKQSYYLEIISSEIKRLSRLVERMLNLSRIEEGKVQLNYANFNISKQLVDTLLTFEKPIEEKGIGITGLDTLDTIMVTADETMMNQVIYNLIENAVKFTPKNGRIDFRIIETATNLTISIGNTGNGIPSEMLPRIFERFYKVDASRSYDKKGAGLGLYLVKTFIDLHNGDIEVSSIEGEYTQFKFSIPKNNHMINNRGENNG